MTNFLKHGEFFSCENINIHYHYLQHPDNSKPVLVLLHGFLSSLFSFRKLIPLLEEQFSILAIDWPPFGFSEKSRKFVYRTDNIANAILSMLEAMKLKSVTVIGHSMGGQVALKMAKLAPNKVDKLVLISCSAYMQRFPKKVSAATFIPFFHLFLRRKLEKQGVHHNLRNVVYHHGSIDHEMINGYEQPFYQKGMFEALTRFLRHREDDLTTEQLAEIPHPVLLIWGNEDRIIPLKTGKRLLSDLSNAALKIFTETGHLVPEERAEETANEIVQFIKAPSS
ncbi:alpha/beta hydrolase [Bacillus tianshenii]|nr:alpha/beta hydrolase [Bacillus tianshenii]